MFNVAGRLRLFMTAAVTTLMCAVFACLVLAGTAFADHAKGSEPPVTLNGVWASFNRCPVDDPTMLAADGEKKIALCLADISPNGSMTLGSLTVALKGTNHQLGFVVENETGLDTPIAPAGGALAVEPVEVPGGLQGLICPGKSGLAREICQHHHHKPWLDGANDVAWTLESAGTPYNFNLFGGLALNTKFADVPVKVHLQNRLLGNNCYIGTDAEPILLEPETLAVAPSTEPEVHYDGNGTPDPEGPMARLQFYFTQSGGSFAVPSASGCGFRGIYDQAINHNAGLPSPVGSNSLVFNEMAGNLTAISGGFNTPDDGQKLSKYWHSAVVPSETDGQH